METIIADKYILGKKIGKGAFGEIYKGNLDIINVFKAGLRTALKRSL